MVLKLAIAEDDPKCAADLRSFVERYCREHGLELRLQVFPDGMELVVNHRPVWDVLLLDIEMPHLDGMKAAERIRRADPAVLIIFITYMGKYAIRGYEVSALDFVLKPVNYSKLAMRLRHVEEIIRRLKARQMTDCIVVKEDVSKEALKKYGEDTVNAVGATWKQKDVFGYEVNLARLEQIKGGG